MSDVKRQMVSGDAGALSVEPLTFVDHAVHERLDGCAYRHYFNRVTWRFAHGTLELRGQVSTFYLKQVLQTLLCNISYVERIVNDVEVVNARGLSSTRHDRKS